MPLAKSSMKYIKLFLFLCIQSQALTSKSQIPDKKLTFVNYTEVGGLFGRVVSGTQSNELVENKTSLS